MGKFYLKAAFAAAFALFSMGGATQANAEEKTAGTVTTNADIDFSNSIVTATTSPKYSIAGTVSSMTWDNQWTQAPSVADGMLRVGNFEGKVALVGDAAGSKDVVTISFDLGAVGLSKKNFKFYIYDTDGNKIVSEEGTFYGTSFSTNDLNWAAAGFVAKSGDNPGMTNDTKNSITVAIDYAKKTITSTITTNKGSNTYTATLSSTKPVGSIGIGSNYGTGSRCCYLDNLKITTTTGDYNTQTYSYQVKYVDSNGNEIKTAAKYDGYEEGATPVLSSDDKANFSVTDNDVETRYIYVSDDAASKTVANDNSTVVTVTFREAAKYDYTISSAYDGNALSFSQTGSCWEDQNKITVQYPRFQTYNSNVLVELEPTNNNLTKDFTIDQDGYTGTLEYAATGIEDLYLLSEAEDLGTSLSTNSTTFSTRVSGGKIIYGASGKLLTLPAGKYKFTLGTIGGDSKTHKVSYTVSAGGTQIASGSCTGNYYTAISSEEFTLTDSRDITFTCSDPASTRGIDLVYVEKTGDVTPSVTIDETSHLASFSSTNTVTVPNDVVVYIASAPADNTVTLTKVDTKVIPANTGVILYSANAGEKTLTYEGTTDASFSGNALTGTGSAAYTVQESDNIYALVAGEQAVAKVNSGVAIPAGKAYMAVTSGAKKLNIVFEGVVTAIDGVEAANADADAPAYNLAGQRVGKSYKGVVVKNGRKYIVK